MKGPDHVNELVPWITLAGGAGVSIFVAVTGWLNNRKGVKGRETELSQSARRDTIQDRDSLIANLQEERDTAVKGAAALQARVDTLVGQLDTLREERRRLRDALYRAGIVPPD